MSKERSVALRDHEVAQILSGTRTQFVKPIKHRHGFKVYNRRSDAATIKEMNDTPIRIPLEEEADAKEYLLRHCPYGKTGGTLWVREAYAFVLEDKMGPVWDSIIYRADLGNEDWDGAWRPSTNMNRSISRITLEVADVKVQRLHEMTAEDAVAEGITPHEMGEVASDTLFRIRGERWPGPVLQYAEKWVDMHGLASWESNPWVWRVTFRVQSSSPVR